MEIIQKQFLGKSSLIVYKIIAVSTTIYIMKINEFVANEKFGWWVIAVFFFFFHRYDQYPLDLRYYSHSHRTVAWGLSLGNLETDNLSIWLQKHKNQSSKNSIVLSNAAFCWEHRVTCRWKFQNRSQSMFLFITNALKINISNSLFLIVRSFEYSE